MASAVATGASRANTNQARSECRFLFEPVYPRSGVENEFSDTEGCGRCRRLETGNIRTEGRGRRQRSERNAKESGGHFFEPHGGDCRAAARHGHNGSELPAVVAGFQLLTALAGRPKRISADVLNCQREGMNRLWVGEFELDPAFSLAGAFDRGVAVLTSPSVSAAISNCPPLDVTFGRN